MIWFCWNRSSGIKPTFWYIHSRLKTLLQKFLPIEPHNQYNWGQLKVTHTTNKQRLQFYFPENVETCIEYIQQHTPYPLDVVFLWPCRLFSWNSCHWHSANRPGSERKERIAIIRIYHHRCPPPCHSQSKFMCFFVFLRPCVLFVCHRSCFEEIATKLLSPPILVQDFRGCPQCGLHILCPRNICAGL